MNTEEKNRQLAVFPRSNPHPVLEFSSDGQLTYSNDAAQRMAASLGEQSMLPILPPDTKAIIHQCLLTGENKLNLHTTLKDRTIAWSFIPIAESRTVHCYANEITERLALENPVTWWPIERDYFIDDFQFRLPGPLPPRVDLKTGAVRMLDSVEFKGKGRTVPGGAATVLCLALNPQRELESLTVRAIANDVVVGLMSATLLRPDAATVQEPASGGR